MSPYAIMICKGQLYLLLKLCDTTYLVLIKQQATQTRGIFQLQLETLPNLTIEKDEKSASRAVSFIRSKVALGTHLIGWTATRVGVDGTEKRETSAISGNRLRFHSCPAPCLIIACSDTNDR